MLKVMTAAWIPIQCHRWIHTFYLVVYSRTHHTSIFFKMKTFPELC